MQKRKVIVFGAGADGCDFIKMTRYENEVLSIVDNDSKKWGEKIEGIEIQPVEILKNKEFSDVLVVITIKNFKAAVLQLESLGVNNYVLGSLIYEADLKCKSREIMDIYMPDEITGQYPNREIKNAWMNHLISNYSQNRQEYISSTGKLLDMGCGCGKQLFHWLCKGYDAYGIDCCDWKMKYCMQKIDDFLFPQEWKQRFIFAYGESLPFEDEIFDTITCWYVLEHVNDYRECIQEMLRVLKKGGYILLNAPDYRNSYEEHYGIDFHKSLVDYKEEFHDYLLKVGADMSIYEELNFIQLSDVYEELSRYTESGKGKLEIINFEERNPASRVTIRDNQIVCGHRIALAIKKIS